MENWNNKQFGLLEFEFVGLLGKAIVRSQETGVPLSKKGLARFFLQSLQKTESPPVFFTFLAIHILVPTVFCNWCCASGKTFNNTSCCLRV